MGQKFSTKISRWTIDDWAFGTTNNVVPVDEVSDDSEQTSTKYFADDVIENDPSMQQMQHDLLLFDNKLKRLFFWRKKNRQSKAGNYSDEEYYPEDEEYYDGYPHSIPEEEEPPLSPIYNERRVNGESSWTCEICETKNKSSDAECRQCQENERNF